MKRAQLVLACGAVLALVVLGEGVASLVFGRSLRELGARAAALPEAPATPLVVDQSEGPYRLPDDPLVSYTLRRDAALTFREGPVATPLVTDELGMRRRSGGEPAEAQRVVVLGDSVAFGFGLDEGGPLAEQLEVLLNACAPERPVVCHTVAVPSWNVDNAFRFLLDHLERYRPDVVLWLPVANDLEDGYGVTESGERRAGEDPLSRYPLLHARPEWAFVKFRARELGAAGVAYQDHVGHELFSSGWTPFTRARFERAAETVGRAAARLARAGARTAFAGYVQSDFQRELRASFLRAGLELPELALFEELERADTLGLDPHPSARTVGVLARWVAEELVARGWIRCARAPAPEALDAETRARRAHLPARAEALAWSEAWHARAQRELEPRVAYEDLSGALQVLGGLNLDGTLAPWFGAGLRGGSELVVRLAPLAERPGLYPLRVRVVAQERELGVLELGGTQVCEARFALRADGAPLDVFLFADDHTLLEVRGRSWLACARLVALEVLP